MNEPITVFVPFTRYYTLERWLENLFKQTYPTSLINLCFIIDIDDPRIASDLNKFIEYAAKCERPYRSFHVKMNTDWQPDETHLSIRRMRIADVHNQSKHLVGKTDGKIVIGLEDDTVFEDRETFSKLVNLLDDNVGFAQGVQVGRHGTNYVGAWRCDSPFIIKHIHTCLPPEGKWEGVEEIDAGGMFGYATYKSLYMQHDYFSSSGAPYATDVNYGIWLRQRNWKCVIDWGLLFGHNVHNVILHPTELDAKLMEVNYYRNETGGWDRRDYENSNHS